MSEITSAPDQDSKQAALVRVMYDSAKVQHIIRTLFICETIAHLLSVTTTITALHEQEHFFRRLLHQEWQAQPVPTGRHSDQHAEAHA